MWYCIKFSSAKPKLDDRPIFEFSNGYIPQYIKGILKWYDRDGLKKYNEISWDPEEWLGNKTVINFDTINNECRGDRMVKIKKEHKTVTSKDFIS